jgi:dihydrofolate reductase/thymidylate synthase
MRKPSFSIVVAMDSQQGIGKNNNLPWSLSADLTHFKSLTTTVTHLQKRNAVIMGRKTWNSLPTAFRPLPNRLNIVITRQERENNDVTYFFKGLNPVGKSSTFWSKMEVPLG